MLFLSLISDENERENIWGSKSGIVHNSNHASTSEFFLKVLLLFSYDLSSIEVHISPFKTPEAIFSQINCLGSTYSES